MDITALGIVAGILATAVYTLTRALRQKSFDIGATITAFLAGFSIPTGAQLIRVALSGDLRVLPSSWREYVAAAGIVAIGLSMHFLAQSLRNAWAKQATIAPPNKQQGSESHTDSPAN
jgi:phosphatidylserine synthase